MKHLKKHITILLLISLLGGLLFSCAETQENEQETTADQAAGADSTTTDATVDYPRTNKDSITVCIDAGHGFGDVGCGPAYMNAYEYEITLSAAMLLQDKLAEKGITVILTHDGETFPTATEITSLADQYSLTYKPENMIENDIFSAYERVIWANVLDRQTEGGLDLFVSLHVNSIENAPEVSGMSIDYCEDNPNLSFLREFSKELERAYLDADLTSEFVIFEDTYDDSFIVTKYTEIPAVLIEMGYATNTSDAQNMRSDTWQNSFASLLAEKICAAYGK
ncbi:MAG: N-acetylmuramoyl-L-alanine amidase [Clostridiales bacterium]|nr:N-acetylmuramoyl-L-alanine amidase [Clostridiales bacterium]